MARLAIQNSENQSPVNKEYPVNEKKNRCEFDPILVKAGSYIILYIQYKEGARLYNGAPSSLVNPLEVNGITFCVHSNHNCPGYGRNDQGGPIFGWTFNKP